MCPTNYGLELQICSWLQVNEVPEQLNENSFYLLIFFFSSLESVFLIDKCPYRTGTLTLEKTLQLKGKHPRFQKSNFQCFDQTEIDIMVHLQ